MWELEYMVAVNVLYGKSLVLAISDTVAFGSTMDTILEIVQ